MPKIALLILLSAAPALAFDPFEIQVYDGTIDEPGKPGLELHVNRHHDATRITFEPSFGIFEWWELGAYFLTEQGHYAGYKLRSKFVLAKGDFRVGMNFEISFDPNDQIGGEIRPILAWENERFLVAANPNISFPAAFEPGVMAKVKVGPVAVGLEYYGSFPDKENYLFAAVDVISLKQIELNFGVGEGSAPVAKMIFGVTF